MFLEVFLKGLRDSFSPLPLVTAILFFLFLLIVGFRRSRVFTAGLFFLLAIWLTNLLLIFGGFDDFLSNPGITTGIQVIYLMIALGLVVLGALHFWDWYRFNVSLDESRLIFPRASFLHQGGSVQGPRHRNLAHMILTIIGAIVLGFCLTILSSASIQDYETFIDYLGWVSEANIGAWGALALHSFAFTLPIFGMWVLVLVIMSSVKIKEFLDRDRTTSTLKILAAGIFLATGLGLGYMFLVGY